MPVLTVLGELDITVQNLYAAHKSPLPRPYATCPSVRVLVIRADLAEERCVV